MEVRGIGIINVAAMFGVKSIRLRTSAWTWSCHLKTWNEVAGCGPARHGTAVRQDPGREDSAHHHSGAARAATWPGSSKWPRFQTKLKLTGYNPAQELNERLLAQMAETAKAQK